MVEIVRADGKRVRDIRPLVRLDVSVIAGKGDRQESGSFGTGGRVGIHLGGATQLLFGIRGKRWDENAKHTPFVTDAWVRPRERPDLLSNIEDGCYW